MPEQETNEPEIKKIEASELEDDKLEDAAGGSVTNGNCGC